MSVPGPLFSNHGGLGAAEHELKFFVPQAQTQALRSWLSTVLRAHPSHAVCTICSLYFDTATMESAEEKAASNYAKSKYRLRWYADLQGAALPVPAQVEVKVKTGALRRKARRPVALSPTEIAALPLESAQWEGFFREHFADQPLLLPTLPLRPVLELRYVRHRFVHPLFKEAFCLDEAIRCERLHPSMGMAAGARLLGMSVFEQKGAADAPVPVLRGLPRFDSRRSAFSKYVLALQAHGYHA